MKLVKSEERVYVECQTSGDGYESNEIYIFSSMEEVKKFLGLCDDYEKNIYPKGVDIYGQEHSIGYYEHAEKIYAKTEYEIVEGQEVDREKMMEIGKDVAIIWGAECYDFEIDYDLKEVAFFCVEYGEDFTTTMSFDEIEEQYYYKIE